MAKQKEAKGKKANKPASEPSNTAKSAKSGSKPSASKAIKTQNRPTAKKKAPESAAKPLATKPKAAEQKAKGKVEAPKAPAGVKAPEKASAKSKAVKATAATGKTTTKPAARATAVEKTPPAKGGTAKQPAAAKPAAKTAPAATKVVAAQAPASKVPTSKAPAAKPPVVKAPAGKAPPAKPQATKTAKAAPPPKAPETPAPKFPRSQVAGVLQAARSVASKTTKIVESTKERKSHLTSEELVEFKQILLDKRRELVEDMVNLEGDAKRSGGEGGSLSGTMPIHMADLGTDTWEQEFTLNLIEKERGIVREIDEALDRIEKKTYGTCLATGRPISKARLRVKPWAKFCIEYARKRELGMS